MHLAVRQQTNENSCQQDRTGRAHWTMERLFSREFPMHLAVRQQTDENRAVTLRYSMNPPRRGMRLAGMAYASRRDLATAGLMPVPPYMRAGRTGHEVGGSGVAP